MQNQHLNQDGKDKDQTIKITVDSPLITFYPYINEKEYENNTLKSIEELRKWAEAKFKNEELISYRMLLRLKPMNSMGRLYI